MNKFKWKNKYSLVFLLSILLCGLLLLGGALVFRDTRTQLANAQVQVEMSKKLENEYAFGDKFTLPACTFQKGDKSVVGVGSLEFPDGSQNGETEITLNQSGKYVLRYIAIIDEKTYTQEYGFTVYGKLATYGSSKTSVKYGLCTDLGASTRGLMVKIANGDALTFDHVFEMGELSMATKLVEGFVVPTTQGSVDFAKMVFTFTDVEDPSVQLVFNGNFYDDSNAHGLTFFTAAGNGQIQTGLEKAGQLHVGTSMGCMVPHSFMAVDTGLYWGAKKAEPTTPDSKLFCISYDAKTQQAWAGGKIIADLDDSNYYDSLWFGFPSGKAKLTISALNYNNATANICFTEILGVDLSAETYVDNDLPVITIDNEYEEMPNAVVGGSYPVPTARAIDLVSGACDVNVSVWYEYGSENRKMVDVQNGRFQVNDVGTYAIVYEASDYSGNISREVLWVRAYLSGYLPKLSVTIDDTYDTEITVGTLQSLPNVTVEGGSGKNTVTYTITKGREVCENVDGKFILEKAGDWDLTCTAVDYIGNQAIAVCKLKGVVGDKPVAVDEVQLPAAYVSGSSYTLPVLYAYDYRSGEKVQKTCDVQVTYGEKSATYQSGESFIPTVDTHQDKITLAYVCDGAEFFRAEVPVLVVFDKERIPGNTERYRDVIRVERYFYTKDDLSFENGYALSDVNGLLITANSAAESAKTVFANAQLAEFFSLDFLTVPNASKFLEMSVTLTDSLDSSVSVKASLHKGEGETVMTVGDTVLSLAMDFDGGVSSPFNVGFSNNRFIVNSTTSVAISKTENGKAFEGFPSGKIYFEIEMKDVAEGASIFVSKVCGANVSNAQDRVGPFVTTENDLVTNGLKDSRYTLQKVLVGDILSSTAKASVTVLDPNGQIVTSVDGVALDGADGTVEHQIVLSTYGVYSISVIATEGSEWKYSNESSFEYVVTVIDGEKPMITFKKEFPKELKVGEALVIPEYEVSDNYSAAENITVMTLVTNPKGMPVYLFGETNAVRCEYAGVYEVTVYVYDETGNLTTFKTSVTVTEGK